MGGESVADHPRQTATFLFTDIESHTAAVGTHPEAMAVAARGTRRAPRATPCAAGGEVVKYGGDAVMAVFGDAAAAVAAAYEGQRVLDQTRVARSRHVAGADGIHTGCGVRARRRLLRFRGDPGSAPVRRRARPAGRRRRRGRGAHTVRRVDRSRRTPSPRARRRGTRVPARRRRRCGRSSRRCGPRSRRGIACRGLGRRSSAAVGSMDAVAARIAGAHRLVTLTGVGGSGKTRLAIEAARAASRRPPRRRGISSTSRRSPTRTSDVSRPSRPRSACKRRRCLSRAGGSPHLRDTSQRARSSS